MKTFQLLKYIVKDSIKYHKEGRPLSLYEIFMFVGDVGQGKTISAISHAKELKRKDDRIKIYTNFHMEGQDGQIDHWSDMLKVPSYSILIIDEVQTTFDNRSFKNFPKPMLSLITQNRKWGDNEEGNRPSGVRILFTTQDFDNTDVFIRRLCNKIIVCNAFYKGRLIINRWYKRKEFEKTNDEKKRNMGIKWFVATDEIRESYNTHVILESLKTNDEK